MIELANEPKKASEVKVQLKEERLQLNSDEEPSGDQHNDNVPNHIVKVSEERNLKIQEIIEWIEGPCETWFTKINQVCKSMDEVQRVENQYSCMMDEFEVSSFKIALIFIRFRK
jgi:hypothetical protein